VTIRRFNLDAPAFGYDPDDPPGYGAGMVRFGPHIGGETLGGSVYDVPPGASICPYHYEYADEEWLIVLLGTPTVRHPGGTDVLASGDVMVRRDSAVDYWDGET
jgi:uncharacterized cupin superfamily protein